MTSSQLIPSAMALFPIRPHSEVLGVRTATYESEGGGTIQPIIGSQLSEGGKKEDVLGVEVSHGTSQARSANSCCSALCGADRGADPVTAA